MTTLTHEDVRLLFMREGKLAGAIWSWLDDDTPDAVRAHLLALIEATTDSISALPEEDRDALLGIFFASARNARTPGEPTEQHQLNATPDALRERVRAMRELAVTKSAGREEAWSEPSPQALDIVRTLSADASAGVSLTNMAVLYRELGRLAAPMWISGEFDNLPDIVNAARQSLDLAVNLAANSEEVFDESRAQYRVLTEEEALRRVWDELFSALRGSREIYFAENPIARMPSDPVERRAEEGRRASRQEEINARAMRAVDQLVVPLLDAVTAYVDSKAAEEEALASAAREHELGVRAAAGFDHPGSQPYGVSARGAEFWVADALRWLGEHDAEVTRATADGGVDVMSARLAVSVKHYSGAVPVEELREIFGVAVTTGRAAILWTSGTLTQAARQFADVAPVAVVRYDVETGKWVGANEPGEVFLEDYAVSAPIRLSE